MNIVVMSPHSRFCGNTTVASLLALEMAAKGQKTCLTHFNITDESLLHYLGVDRGVSDSTASPSKLAKMLKEKVIGPAEVPNYCRNVTKDFDVLIANDKKLDPETQRELTWFELTSFPYDIMVYDLDTEDLESEAVKLALERADLIVWVLSQSLQEMKYFKATAPKLAKIICKPSVAIVNRFNRQIATIKDVQSEIGVKEMGKEAGWLRLRYNPICTKYTNGGSLHYLHAAMRNNDYAVLDMYGDLTQISNRVLKFNRKFKSQLSKNKANIRQKQLDDFIESRAAEEEAAEAEGNAEKKE